MRLTQKTAKLLDGTLTDDELAVAIAQIWLEGARYAWSAASLDFGILHDTMPKHIRRRNPYGKV